MQSIGVFPPGMLVQLRSSRLGIVLEPKRRHAGPRVLAFYATRDRETGALTHADPSRRP